MEDGKDLLSNLPQDLIHQIYRLLPMKEVTKTSVLSKEWYDKFLNYEAICLYFDFERYYSLASPSHPFTQTILEAQEKRFISMIDNCINGRLNDVSHPPFLRCMLHVGFHKMQFLTALLKDWITLILVKRIPEFSLDIHILELDGLRAHYYMGEGLIFGGFLKKLFLNGCTISEFSLIAPNLERLVIENCRFEDGTSFPKMLRNTRKLRLLKLFCVENVSSLCVSDMHALTELQCVSCSVAYVNIKAANLRKFCFSRPSVGWTMESFQLKCRALEELKLTGARFTDEYSLHSVTVNLPNLKILRLTGCSGLMGLNFSAPSLQSLELLHVYFIGEMYVDTPNLQHLVSQYGPLMTPHCALCNMKCDITFEIHRVTHLGSKKSKSSIVVKECMARLVDWRNFLTALTGENEITVVVTLDFESMFMSEELKVGMELLTEQKVKKVFKQLLHGMIRRNALDDKTTEEMSHTILPRCAYSLFISISLKELSKLIAIKKKLARYYQI